MKHFHNAPDKRALSKLCCAPYIRGMYGQRRAHRFQSAKMTTSQQMMLANINIARKFVAENVGGQPALDALNRLEAALRASSAPAVGTAEEVAKKALFGAFIDALKPDGGLSTSARPRWRDKKRGTTYTGFGRGRLQGEILGMDSWR